MTKEDRLKNLYVKRDVSWMYFNHRILQEAKKEYVPLLERLSFLGIYSNNLDEFFRVRVASLNRVLASNDVDKHKEGEPWLIEAGVKHTKGGHAGSSGATCLPNADAASDEGKALGH